jgi:hypothetical protein
MKKENRNLHRRLNDRIGTNQQDKILIENNDIDREDNFAEYKDITSRLKINVEDLNHTFGGYA